MIEVQFYSDEDGKLPANEWLESLPEKARQYGPAKIPLLQEHGHQLRRPHCDILRDGIWELRWSVQRVQYRLFYFYSGNRLIIVAHGTSKKDRVREKDIGLTIQRKKMFEANEP